MTVRITKPEINISEKLSELDKPSGVAGESLLRAETPQEAFNLIGAGRKNLLINGDFRVAQRGNSGTAPIDRYGQYLSVDRWATYRIGQTFTQDDALINGEYKRVLKASPSNLGVLYLYQVIEKGAALISGKDVTLSFWAKADSYLQIKTGIRYATSGNGDFVLNDSMEHFELGTDWKYYTATLNLEDTALSSDYTRNAWLMLFSSGSFEGNNAYFADIQLELGSVATPFEHRTYGEEVALCRRYYQIFVYNNTSFQASRWTTGQYYGTLNLPTPMRVAPSLVVSDNAALKTFGGGSTADSTNIVLDGAGTPDAEASFVELYLNSTLTTDSVFVRINNSNDFISFDAEL